MIQFVLDASVVLKWFTPKTERHGPHARRLRDQYEKGELLVLCPRLLFLEVINVAARSWGWEESALAEMAAALDGLCFDMKEPALAGVASWTARGLTAFDAEYVALAEERDLTLITDDDLILSFAGDVAQPLTSV